MLWGLTLGIVADLTSASGQPLSLPFLKGDAISFRFEKAHWIVDWGARSIFAAELSRAMKSAVVVAVTAVLVSFLLW